MTTTIDLKARQGTYGFHYMTVPMRTPTTIVGELAVHRRGGNPAHGWTVSHVATEAHAEKAMPARFFARNGTVHATKGELIAWAKAWQEAAPDFFTNMRERPPAVGYKGVVHQFNNTVALAQAALDAGRAL